MGLPRPGKIIGAWKRRREKEANLEPAGDDRLNIDDTDKGREKARGSIPEQGMGHVCCGLSTANFKGMTPPHACPKRGGDSLLACHCRSGTMVGILA